MATPVRGDPRGHAVSAMIRMACEGQERKTMTNLKNDIRTISLRDDETIVGVPLGPGPSISARIRYDDGRCGEEIELDTVLLLLDSNETIAMIMSRSMIAKFGKLIESVVIGNSSASDRVALERQMGAVDPDQAAKIAVVKLKFNRKSVFDASGRRLVQYHCGIISD